MKNADTQHSGSNNKKSDNFKLWPMVPVALVFVALAVSAAIPSLRSHMSETEKRPLTKFPDFTVQSLIEGTFFDDIGLWYSDTFPFRESWVSLSAKRSELYGFSNLTIHGNLASGDEIPHKPTLPLNTPVPSPTWGGIDPNHENLETNTFNGLLQVGDSVFSQYAFSQVGADRYSAVLAQAAATLAGKSTVYNILAPTGMGILLPPSYVEGIGGSDQGLAAQYMYSSMGDKVVTVPIYETLLEHNNEYLYFRTDHHWTALAAYYSYREFCAAAGKVPAELESFEQMDFPGFLGSFYGAIGGSSAMKNNPDTVIAYYPPGDIEMIVTNKAGKAFSRPVIADMSGGGSDGQYLSFIAGDNPHTVIYNRSIADGSSCLLIKESFGNCYAPFLTQNYETVHIIDYRHYKAMQLSAFVDSFGVDDVIFLNVVPMAEADGPLRLLEAFVD